MTFDLEFDLRSKDSETAVWVRKRLLQLYQHYESLGICLEIHVKQPWDVRLNPRKLEGQS